MPVHDPEICVHVDDCGLLEAELAALGYRRARRRGSFITFVGRLDSPPAGQLVEHHGHRHGRELRVRPNRQFTPARMPRGAYPLLDVGPAGAAAGELSGAVLPAADYPFRPVVGVIDTGIVLVERVPHTFLQGRVRYDELKDVDEPDVGERALSDGHGSFVAGVILREAPAAILEMRGVIDKTSGKWEDEAVANAIDELRDKGVALINFSFSGDRQEVATPEVILTALNKLGPNVVVVASGGNTITSGPGTVVNVDRSAPAYPAAQTLDHARMVAVGAVDETLRSSPNDPPAIADVSCRGDWVTVYANGTDVLGPHLRNGWARWSGTSFACATVTGRIAAAMTDPSNARAAAERVLNDARNDLVQDGAITRPYVRSRAGDHG